MTMGIQFGNAANYSAGEIYYCEYKKRIFGCVILFKQQDYYLLALSKQIEKSKIRSACPMCLNLSFIHSLVFPILICCRSEDFTTSERSVLLWIIQHEPAF